MTEKWVKEVYEKILTKEEQVAKRNAHKIPYTTKDGVFDDKSGKEICWWTNGFWGGMMWQLYHATGNELYREIAIENEEKLDANLMNRQGMDHDSGFKWLPTAVAHYRLDGNGESRNRALLAADNLAGRFNPVGRFIRAWNNWDGNEDGSFAGRAIIDCMMNLPLLYWAGDELHDPKFYHVAKMHADTAMEYFVRDDGSVNHIVDFNAETEESITISSGSLTLEIGKNTWYMKYMRNGKVITESRNRDLALMKTDWKGLAYDKGDNSDTYIRQQARRCPGHQRKPCACRHPIRIFLCYQAFTEAKSL